ncbi:alpha/beta fold hydrolase [Agrobacterium tumefaciens]|uniref:alpha/beta fold hydrolase n=1 Tax=Agrobacterium tumefaciens TaxID=358 RepID=UPI00220975F9|nr:alpha/beta hydrolase [Agrobacterium tumefaciens]
MEEQFFDTSHGRIAYDDNGGAGLPVVMLHANSLCKESFAPQIDALRDTCRIIALDLPGHGQSSDATDPRRSYCMSGYADVVAETLSGIGVTRYVLLGHSLGGHVALELLARDEASIAGATIFGTPPIENSIEGLIAGFVPSPDMAYTGSLVITEEQVEMIARMALGEQDERNERFLAAIRRTDGRARQYMMEDAQAGKTSDQRKVAETTSIPLLIINGADDPVVNLDYVDSLSYRNVWTGKPIRLAGTGHAVHREQAQTFNRLLAAFLKSIT